MNKKTYLCIHGHFYQPPRENPWIEAIEKQDNAGADYHNWNDRICTECYRPNALARILDSRGNVNDIINNFELMSFNVGPTLLSWLEEYRPKTYERILEADRLSAKAHGGHGNAIAQAYNHMIMPLANERDKVTQVKWGIYDFVKRFARKPESMWLPETACNEETLDVLIDEGMKYLILSPHQADKMRHLKDEHWTDVANGSIDPTRAYRCFSKKNPEKYIDIFFYDGPVSKAVAFDNLLYDSRIYADRLESARDPHRTHTQIINLATDGETYGHHRLYGDRVLAYLLRYEAAKRNFVITNYGEFLENFPPEYEVKIKSGDNGLGTSWSCPHGVKRWAEHCGCRGGGDDHWRQDWRKPLRETFDWLRDELAGVFEKEGGGYFKDVWQARNDYIQVILDRSAQARKKFFEAHQKRHLTPEEITLCLKLLEMQRSAMLMYTSCGWFFTELSGEETVQVIKYATRALQLAESVSNVDLTHEFMKKLSKAKSNIEFFRDGLGVYDHLVRPSVTTLEKVVSHFAVSSFFKERSDKFKIYCYELESIDQRREALDDLALCFGHVKVRSMVTLEEIDAVYALLQSEIYDFYCYVKPFADIKDYHQLKHELFSEFNLAHRNKVGGMIYEHFGTDYFSLKDLFKEEKIQILEALSRDGLERFKELYEDLYQRHRRIIDVYRMAQIPLPEAYRFIVEHRLSDDFNQLVTERLLSSDEAIDKANAIRMWAKEAGLKLNRAPSQEFLTKKLNKNMNSLLGQWNDDQVKECHRIAGIAERLGVVIDNRQAQENYLAIVEKIETDAQYLPAVVGQGIIDFIELGYQLAVNVDRFKDNLTKLIVNPT